ncbi:MAG: hypothetical protein SH868_04255, partial [Bythopirellula sp.]|nr:hypothetical protein [Bythopirellula sp.]
RLLPTEKKPPAAFNYDVPTQEVRKKRLCSSPGELSCVLLDTPMVRTILVSAILAGKEAG